MMELKLDLDDLDYLIGSMRLLGSKGTTGTQASFLELFDGDHERCRRLDQRIAEKMGFEGCYPVSGQMCIRDRKRGWVLEIFMKERTGRFIRRRNRGGTDIILQSKTAEDPIGPA